MLRCGDLHPESSAATDVAATLPAMPPPTLGQRLSGYASRGGGHRGGRGPTLRPIAPGKLPGALLATRRAPYSMDAAKAAHLRGPRRCRGSWTTDSPPAEPPFRHARDSTRCTGYTRADIARSR